MSLDGSKIMNDSVCEGSESEEKTLAEEDPIKETRENPSCVTVFEAALTEDEENGLLEFVRDFKEMCGNRLCQIGDIVSVNKNGRSNVRQGNYLMPLDLLELTKRIDPVSKFNNCIILEAGDEKKAQKSLGDPAITFVLGVSKTIYFEEETRSEGTESEKDEAKELHASRRSAFVTRRGDYEMCVKPDNNPCTLITFRAVRKLN